MFLMEDEQMIPAQPDSKILVDALLAVIEAKKELAKEMRDVPDYTGQYRSEDYYAKEQSDYNAAVNHFGEVMRDFIWKTSPRK